MRVLDQSSVLDALSFASTSGSGGGLPTSAQARVLLIALSVVLVTLLGLMLLTIFRYLLRRQSGSLSRPGRRREASSRAVRELSPWETAGRRASVADRGKSDETRDDDDEDEQS